MGILYIKNAEGKFVAIPSLTGEDGYSPTVLENEENTENIYKLDIQTKNGKITTPNLKGEEGFSPVITENENNTDDIYCLDIETVDGKFTTPNLKGSGVEAPTEEYEYSVKVIGTIGADYYSTGISLDQITSVYETGSPVSDLYGGWTIDSVESDDTSIADFANFNNYTDTNIISENVTVYDLFELSSSEAAGTTYSITYQWNGYQKKATITYTSIEELESIKGITIDRDAEDMCDSILANLKPNEELVLNKVDNIGFGINSTIYGDTINKIIFYVGEKGSIIAYLKNGAIATRSYEENYLQDWDFSLADIDTYITYHSIEDLEARKNETLFFVNEEPDTKIKVIFEALDLGEKFFSGKATSAEEWGIETVGNPALPIFQIIKYHDSASERGCVYAIDSLGNIYIRNIYRSNLDTNWTINYKTEINDSITDEYTTWSSSKINQSIKKTYYNLTQMNLTEDATIDDIMNALGYGEEAIIQISDFSDKEQFLNERGCFFCKKCGPGADDVELWINNFTGNIYCGQASSNSFLRWEPITSNFTIYESAWDFGGHPAYSIVENNKKMANRSMLTYVPDSYADQEQYLNLTSPLVTIIKLDESHYNMTMIDNETEAFYYGILDENNDFNKWVKVGASDGTKIDDSVTGADTTWSSEKIANDYSTKEYVAEQVANASHLKREIVTVIPEAGAAQENTIYMFKVESVLGDDKYQEWQLINGEMVLIGDTSIDLSGYAKTYTTLNELGLTADATIDDVRGALQVGESCIIRTDAFTDLTQFNGIQWGYLKITVGVNKISEIWLNDVTSPYGLYYGRQSSGNFDKWVNISTQRTYTELVQLGLTADATVDDVLSKLQPGETFTSGVTQFTNYQTLFPYDTSNDQYSRVFIQQGTSLATAYVKWFRKDGSREALANLDSNNKIRGWNEHAMNEIIHTSLTESLAGITTTLDLINALVTEYRAKNKPVRFISGNITKTTLTDLPSNYGLLDITVAGYDLVEVRFAQSEFGFKKMFYGFLNRTSSETLFSTLTWSKSNNIYYTIGELNAVKGTNIELVKDEDNTIKIIEALSDREEFVEWFNNGSTMDRFGIPDEFGNKITYLRIIKTDSQYALIIATTNKGFTFSRVYNQGVLEDWCYDRTKATLVTNITTLKLDVTKRNSSWYGAIKLTYLYDTSPVEVEIDFRSVTDTLKWTISKGQKYIKKITYTQDADNKAHYTIGIEFSGTTYGCYQAEAIGGFADINSLTGETFTGETTAVYGNPWGKNNGVTLVSAPEDLGLTSPCTTVQLVQAMRNTFNKTITSGAVGVFNNGGDTITDAPSDYGLLHIEVFGHDRVMIRYDGISGSTYAGSWIGKIKGSNGTFSEITWSKIAFEGESSGDVAWTAATVNSGIGYATNSSSGYTTKYAIKNNVVYVNSNIICNTVKDNGYDTLISGLPAPSTYLFFTLQPDTYGNAPIYVQVDENGNLKLRSGTAGKTYMLSISYPII